MNGAPRRTVVVGTKKMTVFDDGSPDMKLTLYDKGVDPPPKALTYEQGVRIRTGDIAQARTTLDELAKDGALPDGQQQRIEALRQSLGTPGS